MTPWKQKRRARRVAARRAKPKQLVVQIGAARRPPINASNIRGRGRFRQTAASGLNADAVGRLVDTKLGTAQREYMKNLFDTERNLRDNQSSNLRALQRANRDTNEIISAFSFNPRQQALIARLNANDLSATERSDVLESLRADVDAQRGRGEPQSTPGPLVGEIPAGPRNPGFSDLIAPPRVSIDPNASETVMQDAPRPASPQGGAPRVPEHEMIDYDATADDVPMDPTQITRDVRADRRRKREAEIRRGSVPGAAIAAAFDDAQVARMKEVQV